MTTTFQNHAAMRRRALAEALRGFASELRLVDVEHFVCLARDGHNVALEELVESSAELAFRPGALRYGWGSGVDIGWDRAPRVRLDLEFCHAGVNVFFGLFLSDRRAAIDIYGAVFDPAGEAEDDTRRLIEAVRDARI